MNKNEWKPLVKITLFALALIFAAGLVCYPIGGGLPPIVEQTVTQKYHMHNMIDLNAASAGALQCLEGIGEKRALAIIAYREEHGGFSNTEELLRVSGIGDKLFGKIKKHIYV